MISGNFDDLFQRLRIDLARSAQEIEEKKRERADLEVALRVLEGIQARPEEEEAHEE